MILPRKAILTKFLGPTTYRDSRVKAWTEGGHSVTLSWDHGLDTTGNHAKAALKLAGRLMWKGSWHMGGTRDYYVFTLVDDDTLAFQLDAFGLPTSKGGE